MTTYQVTRCPNCQTSFRVTDDHLAAYRGKVRCGRCAFVFQATDHLLSTPAGETASESAATTPLPVTQPPTATATEPAKMSASAPKAPVTPETTALVVPALVTPEVDTTPDSDPLGLDVDQPEPLPTPVPTTQNVDDPVMAQLEQEAYAAQAEPSLTGDSLNQLVEELHQRVKAEERERDSATNSDTATASAQPLYRPILTAEDEALLQVKPKPSPLRWLWLLPISVSMLALAFQIALHYRSALAVSLPGLKPQLESLSALVGESVPLPRESSYLRTEWSELTLVPGFEHLVQVNATLRNHAPFEQALPYLELSLSDESDKIVARKVFAPDQYLPKGEKHHLLTAHGDMRVYLQLDLGQLKTTGYAINWFYP